MVPREFRKSLCIVAGLITLLEAVVWGAVSIYSIGVYNCDWELANVDNGVSVWSMFYITYLMGGCRGSDAASALGYSSSFFPPTKAAVSLQIWFWASAILSIIWITTSVLLIAAVLVEVKGKMGAILYYPWEILTIILVAFDVAGAAFHAIDVFQTMTPDDYAQFTSATTWESLTKSSNEGITSWLPSLFVTLFFCRFVILWIVNILFLSTVYRASNAVSSYKSKLLQSILENGERNKSWRDMFYNDSDPIAFQNQPQIDTVNVPDEANENQSRNISVTQKYTRDRCKTDEFGIPVEEYNNQIQKCRTSNQPQSPYQQRRTHYTSRPVTPDSFNEHWQDIPPPMAGEIKIPPELSRVRPFSYTAGDQPQRIVADISRSNSRAKYPPIPRPDYSVADRRAISLEYIPNRFKVPSPKRHIQTHNSFSYDQHSPSQLKKVPISPKKSQVFTKTVPDFEQVPQSKHGVFPQGNVFHTRQIPQNKNYNINKLY